VSGRTAAFFILAQPRSRLSDWLLLIDKRSARRRTVSMDAMAAIPSRKYPINYQKSPKNSELVAGNMRRTMPLRRIGAYSMSIVAASAL